MNKCKLSYLIFKTQENITKIKIKSVFVILLLKLVCKNAVDYFHVNFDLTAQINCEIYMRRDFACVFKQMKYTNPLFCWSKHVDIIC